MRRQSRVNLTSRDIDDVLDAVDAWRRGSLNALQRVTQRVEAQESTPAFLAACVAILSESFETLGDSRAAELRAALRDQARVLPGIGEV